MKTREAAMVVPRFSAYSGGVRRTLKLLEMSESAGIRFSVFIDLHSNIDERIYSALGELKDEDVIDLYPTKDRVQGHVKSQYFDIAVIPSEFWVPSGLRMSALRIRAPRVVEFQQIPYVTSLDILKLKENGYHDIFDTLHIPRLCTSYFGDSIVKSTGKLLLGMGYVELLRFLRKYRIMAISKTVANQLHRLLGEKQVLVPDIPIGMDSEIVREVRDNIQGEPIYDGVYSARFDSRKGFLDLPHILHFARKALGRELRFALCGISQWEHIDRVFWKEVRRLRLEKCIDFFGDVKKEEDLLDIIARSRCAICPSYGDAFPTTVLQALSVGVPVLSYDLDVIKLDWSQSKAIVTTRIGDGKEFGLCFGSLLRDGKMALLREEALKESDALLRRFTWENVIREEREIYERVIGS